MSAAQLVSIFIRVIFFFRMNTPMWRGWNSLTVVDTLPIQNIGIMQNICASPTRLDVVHLTMVKSEQLCI